MSGFSDDSESDQEDWAQTLDDERSTSNKPHGAKKQQHTVTQGKYRYRKLQCITITRKPNVGKIYNPHGGFNSYNIQPILIWNIPCV